MTDLRTVQQRLCVGLLVIALGLSMPGGAYAQFDDLVSDDDASLAEQVIGYPYNALTGDYADMTDVASSYPLFDLTLGGTEEPREIEIGGETWLVPPVIQVYEVDETSKELFSGKSEEEFLKSISFSVGLNAEGPELFKGALANVGGAAKGGSKTGSRSSTQTAYARYDVRETVLRAAFALPPKELRAYLLPDVLEWIDTAPLKTAEERKEFFNAYAFVITDALFGGKIALNYSTDMKDTQDLNQVKVALNAKFTVLSKKDVGVDTAGGFSHTTEQAKSIQQQNLRLQAYGGSADTRPATDQYEFADKYLDWQASLLAEPTLIAFPKGGLTPIWEFAETPARRKAIEQAFVEFARDYSPPTVTVYSECNFKGQSVTLQDAGLYDQTALKSQGLDNTISSIKVEDRLMVELCEDSACAQGPRFFVPDGKGTRDIACFDQMSSTPWIKNAISAIRITAAPASADGAYFYDKCEFAGSSPQPWAPKSGLYPHSFASLRLGTSGKYAVVTKRGIVVYPNADGDTQYPCIPKQERVEGGQEAIVVQRAFDCPSGDLLVELPANSTGMTEISWHNGELEKRAFPEDKRRELLIRPPREEFMIFQLVDTTGSKPSCQPIGPFVKELTVELQDRRSYELRLVNTIKLRDIFQY